MAEQDELLDEQGEEQDGDLVELDLVESEVEDTEDGGAVITIDEETNEEATEHFANIIDEVDQSLLSGFISDLMIKIEMDKRAREKRDELYEEGLKRTGLGNDAPGGASFTGATKVVHPLLVESCVDFSARAMKELYPQNGPAKSKIIGEKTTEKLKKAQQKTDFINWQLTEQIEEFRGEIEQLTTQLPLGGGQYLKLMFDQNKQRAVAEFVPIDNMYLPFAATNFYTAERRTHCQYITEQEFNHRVSMGMYKDLRLPSPSAPEYSKASEANDKIEGREQDSYNEDGVRTIYEVTTHLDFGDGMFPYILTIDESTDQGLALYRNWKQSDPKHHELHWVVEFPFIPWRGAYPIGLTHLIGGLSGASTGALRALLDSAHINNIPTAIKLKGGPNGQTINLQATELAEIDAGVTDDIRKLIMPIPFNQPSPVLFQLLGFLIDAGKGVVQTSFEKLSDTNKDMPVGTTLALIEQGMVVFSSIHSRLHAAMGRVLKILHRINASYLTEEMIQEAGDFEVTPEDFNEPMDVIPVSDPNIFSETQRFAQTQAILQRQAVVPQLYDQRKVEELFLQQLKVPDDILVKKEEPENMDPASENVAASMGAPIYVLPKQDHVAHLMVHLPFVMSPVFGQSPVVARALTPTMITHLRDHMLQFYLVESHKAVSIVNEQGLGEEATEQAKIIQEVQTVTESFMSQVAQIINHLHQQLMQQMQPQMPPDTSLQVAQMNVQQRAQAEQLRDARENRKLDQQAQLEQMRTQLDEMLARVEAQERERERQVQLANNERDRQAELQREALRQGAEDQRTDKELIVRERMNTSDNDTALTLAAAEIASGERVAVSTGTGINPNP